MDLAGRTVLVTGASGGIGQAIAEAFAKEGAKLVLSGRRASELEALAERVSGRVVVADLSVRADVTRLLEEAGEVDVLVANAALPGSGELSEYSDAELDRGLEVNFRAPIVLAHALAPRMVARGSGGLVFISSLSGLAATARSSIYNATKFGLRGFALALHDELHGTGVAVSAVLPGFISDAGMFADTGLQPPPGFGTRSPQQVAAAVLEALHANRAEVLVAPYPDRLLSKIGGMAPNLAGRLQRLGLVGDITEKMAAAQKSKR
ncbi:MAG: oxidoreductase [Frankiales bacterium]|nr:oxidoreductase [Frankiales bacterium]